MTSVDRGLRRRGAVVTPPDKNLYLNIKHLKESYLVGLCGLN